MKLKVARLLEDVLEGALVFVVQHTAAALWQSGERVMGVRLKEVRVTGGVQLHVERTTAPEFCMQLIQVIVLFAFSRLVESDQISSVLKTTILVIVKHEYQGDRQDKERNSHQNVFTLAREGEKRICQIDIRVEIFVYDLKKTFK